jgi:hypothetical protein
VGGIGTRCEAGSFGMATSSRLRRDEL